jgi:RNA polymerase sigma-70 factor (ECF subfamily)
MMLPDGLVNTLFQDYRAQLKRYAESLTNDYDQADDLVQEAFIQAAAYQELLSSLNGQQRRSWLYTVVKNRFIDHVRGFRRQQKLLQGLADILSSDAPSTDYAGEINLFERVPSQYRKLLIQRYVYGMTSEEIALELQIPAATIRSRIRLAINWLRNHLDEWN